MTPLLTQFFHIGSLVPLLLFTPVWFVGTVFMVDTGFLMGMHRFALVATGNTVEAVTKFLLTLMFVSGGYSQYLYAAIPLSMTLAFTLAWLFTQKLTKNAGTLISDTVRFPKRFYSTDILQRLSVAVFLSADLILAKHYLSAEAAGEYGLLTLPGKMIFFATTLVGQFIVPTISRELGKGKPTPAVFYRFLFVQSVMATLAFVTVGLLGFLTIPLLLGPRSYAIVPYLPIYGLSMVYFTTATSIVTYHQVRKEYLFSFVGFLVTILQIGGFILLHDDIASFTRIIFVSAALAMGLTGILHALYRPLNSFIINAGEFFRIFDRLPGTRKIDPDKLRILIFNWRDTKHMWSGGAEVYLHELAKRWVSEGHRVTLFCGNDRKNPRNEVVDEVQIVRRGGFYLVYFWAFLYLFRPRLYWDNISGLIGISRFPGRP